MAETFPRALPHGPITRVTDDVHCVRGTFKMGPGLVISRTMTLVETDEGVVVINSVRLDETGEAVLAQLGKVAHVVTLSDAHGIDDPYYVKSFGARYWTMPGARQRRLPADRVLGAECPIPGARVLTFANPTGPEGALWLPHGGGTLITCDALQNHVDTEGASWFAKVMTPILGFKGGVIVPKMWRNVHKVKAADVPRAFAPLDGLAFANLITAHGPAVIGGADARVREAIAKVRAQG